MGSALGLAVALGRLLLHYHQCRYFGFGRAALKVIGGSLPIGLLEYEVRHWAGRGLTVGLHRYTNHRSHKNRFALQSLLPYP